MMLLFYLRVGFPFLFYLKNLLVYFFPARMLLIENNKLSLVITFCFEITSQVHYYWGKMSVGLKTFAYKAFVKTHAYI